MSKKILLPRLAFAGIGKNSRTYLPYLAACIFSVFAYFVFDSILYNNIMDRLPQAGYAFMLMRIGFVLLTIIFFLFLIYTNSFLVKRRGRELGLYSLLGMEKRQIGMMMALESLYIYVVVLIAGVTIGLVFSKLFFLLLLNLAGLPVDAEFSIEPVAIVESAVFWGIISLVNLITNLVQVGRSNPVEMMRKSNKADRVTERKGRWLLALLGLICLGTGYYLSITVKLDGMMFLKFFAAILLVIAGTYFIFNWGSVVLLKLLKGRKRFFYRKENFITISGMYSRMKKNANSLVNICIFSTMVIITLLCTVAVYAGTAGMMEMDFPHDLEVHLPLSDASGFADREAMLRLAEAQAVTLNSILSYRYMQIGMEQQEN
ncbi:MAG: hypothetical protein LBV33_09140, partial [Lachnospiraceae bacterium]|nr:hypothetical protein [Lachnospiraceae bacterium]